MYRASLHMSSVIRFMFPYFERAFRFLRTDTRQEYLIGITGDKKSLEKHLRSQGFKHQLFAWVDDGQIASVRKRDGKFQYHIRIFEDGEVRGHYEYTPENAPIKHLRRVKREQRSREFSAFVSEHVVLSSADLHHATISPVRQATPAPSYRA